MCYLPLLDPSSHLACEWTDSCDAEPVPDTPSLQTVWPRAALGTGPPMLLASGIYIGGGVLALILLIVIIVLILR
jgi:hypothetical protein